MKTRAGSGLTGAHVQEYVGKSGNQMEATHAGITHTNELAASDGAIEQRTQAIRSDLRELGSRNWSLWALAVLVIFAMTAAIATLSLQVIEDPHDPFYQFHISQAVRGLVGLVLLFSVYTLYQQLQLRRTRVRLAEQVDVAAREQMRAEEYLKLAMLDPLTGLHNRRYAQERLVAEISRAQRQKSSLTVLMMDLDELKRINDQYGHGAGDLALKTFGERLSKAIRGSDLAVRIGGDEFVVLLPDCSLGQVQTVLDRLSALELEMDKAKITFHFSAGWTDYRNGETPEELLHRADHALYAEKQSRKREAHTIA
jgi:diguanylate cyclase (GGDEF)-like protein